MENNYSLYVHTFPNSKKYVGITSIEPKKRWRSGSGYCKYQPVKKAIQKYGWSNIEHEIICQNLTRTEAEQKEIEFIAKYKTTNIEYGYNVQNGGMHKGKVSEATKKKISQKNKGKIFSDETKTKISQASKKAWSNEEIRKKILEARKGRVAWNKGIPQSEIAKKKNRQSHLGKPAWNKGLHTMTEEHKQKLIQINKGKTPWNKGKKYSLSEETKRKFIEKNAKSKKVICLETKKIYTSARQCSLDMGIDRSGITRNCNSILKQIKGYHFMWFDEYTRNNNKGEYIVSNAIFD